MTKTNSMESVELLAPVPIQTSTKRDSSRTTSSTVLEESSDLKRMARRPLTSGGSRMESTMDMVRSLVTRDSREEFGMLTTKNNHMK